MVTAIRNVSNVVTITGSPAVESRSARLATYAANHLGRQSRILVEQLSLRRLPAQDLLSGQATHPEIAHYVELVQRADAIVLATPVYKAAYSGLLKLFLDLLPQDGFRNKVVLPIATGGSPGHMLAIDYALKPVLSALGAQHVLAGIYAVDQQINWSADNGLVLDARVETRLIAGLNQLTALLAPEPQTASVVAARVRYSEPAELVRCSP